IVMFYDFRKSFNNLASPYLPTAEPVNILHKNSVDGVRLEDTIGSYVQVKTPGFFRYFFYGQKFNIFFQGKFSSNSVDKCISSFTDNRTGAYDSRIFARSDGVLEAKIYFPNGTVDYASWSSDSVLPRDSVERTITLGVNFEGNRFAGQAYFNGTVLSTSVDGYGSGGMGKPLLDIHDYLLLGRCKKNFTKPFNGWLRCWGFAT
uniref:Phage tail protein n=1 Tax=Macrostomum lignano TaxID=282301 RepID=A0A1I8JLL7_9PLAT